MRILKLKLFTLLMPPAVLVAATISFTPSVVAQSNNLISVCYNTTNGQVRKVNAASDCKNGEAFTQWNIVGPQGPQGAPGPQGPPGSGAGGGAPAVYSFNGLTNNVVSQWFYPGNFQFFGPTTSLTISDPSGATLVASGSLSLLANSTSYNPGNAIVQADVCLSKSGQTDFLGNPYVRPIGGGSYAVGKPTLPADFEWFTIAASSSEGSVGPGTYTVGMCAATYQSWGAFPQVVAKGWVFVTK